MFFVNLVIFVCVSLLLIDEIGYIAPVGHNPLINYWKIVVVEKVQKGRLCQMN